MKWSEVQRGQGLGQGCGQPMKAARAGSMAYRLMVVVGCGEKEGEREGMRESYIKRLREKEREN